MSGTGCFPDYSNIKQNSSDVAPNDAFSLAIVTDSAFEQLKDRLIYNYAYKLGNASVSDLKDKLIHLKFDESAVKDTYLKEQLHTASNLKEEFNSATDALRNGAVSLADGASALGKAIPGADKSAAALHDGAMNLYSAICGFKNRFGRYLNESTTVQMVNLSSFGETKYNIRINDAMNDSQIGKQAALVVGVFLIILLVYMLAIFAAGTIEKERPIIGTLYALGYSHHEILSHYMKLPMLVSFLGAALGGIGGFLLTDTMSASSAELYSFPEIIHVFPPYLIAYSLGVPIIFSYIINYFMLSKKLHATPLKMMRAAPHSKSGVSLKLGNMDFKSKYIIRQFFPRTFRQYNAVFRNIHIDSSYHVLGGMLRQHTRIYRRNHRRYRLQLHVHSPKSGLRPAEKSIRRLCAQLLRRFSHDRQRNGSDYARNRPRQSLF